MKKVFGILLVLSALSVVLSGCGSKEEAAGGTTADTGTTTGGATTGGEAGK